MSYKTIYSKLWEAHVTANPNANFSPRIQEVMRAAKVSEVHRAADAVVRAVSKLTLHFSVVLVVGWDLHCFRHGPNKLL